MSSGIKRGLLVVFVHIMCLLLFGSACCWSFTVLLLWWWAWGGELGLGCAWLGGWNVLSHDFNLFTSHYRIFSISVSLFHTLDYLGLHMLLISIKVSYISALLRARSVL